MKIAGRMVAIAGGIILSGTALALWFGASNGQAAGEVEATPAVVEVALPVAAESIGEVAAPRPKTREEKRFARYDRDDNGLISEEEYLYNRKRNFDRLDVDGDGRLSFREYAGSGIEKFAKTDADGDGVLDPAEFATTAPKPRKPAAKAPPCEPCNTFGAALQNDEQENN